MPFLSPTSAKDIHWTSSFLQPPTDSWGKGRRSLYICSQTSLPAFKAPNTNKQKFLLKLSSNLVDFHHFDSSKLTSLRVTALKAQRQFSVASMQLKPATHTNRTDNWTPKYGTLLCRAVEQCLTFHQTHYRSYRGQFLQVRWPNQQCQRTEGQ